MHPGCNSNLHFPSFFHQKYLDNLTWTCTADSFSSNVKLIITGWKGNARFILALTGWFCPSSIERILPKVELDLYHSSPNCHLNRIKGSNYNVKKRVLVPKGKPKDSSGDQPSISQMKYGQRSPRSTLSFPSKPTSGSHLTRAGRPKAGEWKPWHAPLRSSRE